VTPACFEPDDLYISAASGRATLRGGSEGARRPAQFQLQGAGGGHLVPARTEFFGKSGPRPEASE